MAAAEVFEFRGVDNLVYAEVITDTKDSLVFGVVRSLSPVAEIGRTTESSSETHYYDNLPLIVVNSTGSDELTLTVAPLDLPTLADITGQYFDENLGALIEGERENKYFAIGYRTKGTDGKYRYVWRYKGQFGIPDETNATEDDGTDTNNTDLTWTGVSTNYKFTKTGKTAKAMICDERLAVVDFDTFFDVVHTVDNTTGTPLGPAAPTFSPRSGTEFNTTLDVTLACATADATIKYQLISPTGVWLVYEGPITVSSTTNVYAKSVKDGYESAIVMATYSKTTD